MIVNVTLDTSVESDLAMLEQLKMGIIASAVGHGTPDENPQEEEKQDTKPPKKARKPRAKKAAKPAPEPVVEETKPEAPTEDSGPVTLDDVRTAFRSFVGTDDVAKGMQKLEEFGATRLSNLPESKYGEFIASLNG